MKIQYLENNGFHGAWYPCPGGSDSALIYMLGPSVDGALVTTGAKWLNGLGCHVLALSPRPEEKGYHEVPLEQFGSAIAWLRGQGCRRFGVGGGSATAMMALLAASCYPELTLTLAMTPCDFVMEGYYRDKLDGVGERPGDFQSIATWQGKPLPFLPYAYRHPEYWQKLQQEARAGGNVVASREMFARSEQLHPLQEEEMIPVERIQGTIVLAGAEDDCLWDTCRYIRRMEQRLRERGSTARCVSCLYEYGTHFLFPQTMLQQKLHCFSGVPVLLFRSGRKHYRLCRRNREDFEQKLTAEIRRWQAAAAGGR